MYQAIIPAFSGNQWLSGWYWDIPYIAAVCLMKRFNISNRAYFVLLSTAMAGLSVLSFLVFDRSTSSYLLVNTLMMGAYGFLDLFYWGTLGEMLDSGLCPARILSIGLKNFIR